jgi:adenylosuccinate lyase
MLEEYSPPAMAELFDVRARMQRWLEIEMAAMDAEEQLGHAPAGTAATARAHAPRVDEELVDAVRERRHVTGHEMAAFVDVVGAQLGSAETWFHAGLTSADVIDTGNGLMLRRACDVLASRLTELRDAVARLATEHASTPIMGRTHGMYAEPTTFGAKLTGWALRLDRDRERLESARAMVAVGQLSGPVGTYSNIDPRVEEAVCASLGLGRSVNGQFVARDRYAQYVWACANIATTIEAIATQVRLLHTSEVGEVHEAFRSGQKGSSSMPHKKNPTLSMELCGLARVVRGYLVTSMESTVIWQEGDTTSLAVDRVVLPDVSNLTCYQLERALVLVESLDVDTAAMLEKFELSGGLPFSPAVMQALIEGGVDRDAAYRMVQAAAAIASREGVGLESAFVSANGDTIAREDLARAFSLEHALRNVPVVLNALTTNRSQEEPGDDR